MTNGTGRGANISNGQPVAGKTGTSENWRDKWFCGITPQLSTAVWIGGRDEVRMPSSVACDGVYGNFMSQVLAGQPIEQFPTSDTKLTYNTTDFGNGSGSTGSSPEHEGDTEMTDGTSRTMSSQAPRNPRRGPQPLAVARRVAEVARARAQVLAVAAQAAAAAVARVAAPAPAAEARAAEPLAAAPKALAAAPAAPALALAVPGKINF